MKLTDKNVLKWLKAINCLELEEHIDDMNEQELDGRSEIQLFADELSWYLSNYEEAGHCWHDSLIEAKELLKETKNGKNIPLDSKTLKPKLGYGPWEIQGAKDIVNEYKRMLYRYNQLNKLGYYGKYR